MAKQATRKQLSQAVRACAAAGEFERGYELLRLARRADERLRRCTICLQCGKLIKSHAYRDALPIERVIHRPGTPGLVHTVCAQVLVAEQRRITGSTLQLSDWEIAWAGVMKRNVQ